jgi:hypothetical protein
MGSWGTAVFSDDFALDVKEIIHWLIIHLIQVLVATKMLYSSLEGSIAFINDELDNLENFIKSRLRAVIFDRPEKEVEVQNSIESLLLGRGMGKGIDYDRLLLSSISA